MIAGTRAVEPVARLVGSRCAVNAVAEPLGDVGGVGITYDESLLLNDAVSSAVDLNLTYAPLPMRIVQSDAYLV